MPKIIKGTNQSETLRGSGEADVIYGFGGNDQLDGKGGSDRMLGGAGDDSYIVDSQFDKAIELSGEGTDLVKASSAQYILLANVEDLTFTTRTAHIGFGNALDNVITGNSGNDRLFGRSGADTIIGGDGNDYLSGGKGNDTLQGGSGQDTLYAGAGDDVLDGGSGADTLFGGQGNDVYIIDNVRDKAVDVVRGGIDEVRTQVSFKLGSSIENLTIVGSAAASGTGNKLANILTGNDQGNVLSGLGGNDTLDGGKGNDVLIGGLGADRFVFSAALNRTTNTDEITDFSREQKDKIVLSLDIFTDFDEAGQISSDAFHAEAGATRATEDGQFLIYDTTSGALYYDPEGPDGRGPIQIARLGDGEPPALRWSDFLIIG